MINFNKVVGQLFTIKIRDPEARAREEEIRRAIRYLKACNDRELQDLGIPRDDIERAVRYGIAANTPDLRCA